MRKYILLILEKRKKIKSLRRDIWDYTFDLTGWIDYSLACCRMPLKSA